MSDYLPTRHKGHNRLVNRNSAIAGHCACLVRAAEEAGTVRPLDLEEWAEQSSQSAWTYGPYSLQTTFDGNSNTIVLAIAFCFFCRCDPSTNRAGEVILDDEATRFLVYETGILFMCAAERCLF